MQNPGRFPQLHQWVLLFVGMKTWGAHLLRKLVLPVCCGVAPAAVVLVEQDTCAPWWVREGSCSLLRGGHGIGSSWLGLNLDNLDQLNRS